SAIDEVSITPAAALQRVCSALAIKDIRPCIAENPVVAIVSVTIDPAFSGKEKVLDIAFGLDVIRRSGKNRVGSAVVIFMYRVRHIACYVGVIARPAPHG